MENNRHITLDDVEPCHGYQTGKNKPYIHCGRKYVLVDIVKIPVDTSIRSAREVS